MSYFPHLPSIGQVDIRTEYFVITYCNRLDQVQHIRYDEVSVHLIARACVRRLLYLRRYRSYKRLGNGKLEEEVSVATQNHRR
jgi:hypothetical protein